MNYVPLYVRVRTHACARMHTHDIALRYVGFFHVFASVNNACASIGISASLWDAGPLGDYLEMAV
jgi:hypothetical protein